MFSTSTKIAFGFILLTALLFGAIGYIYRQMNLLTAPTGIEKPSVHAGKQPIR